MGKETIYSLVSTKHISMIWLNNNLINDMKIFEPTVSGQIDRSRCAGLDVGVFIIVITAAALQAHYASHNNFN